MTKFIKAEDGQWVNVNHIRCLYVGGCKEKGFRICFSYEMDIKDRAKPYFSSGYLCFGKTYKNEAECQNELDRIMETLSI